MADPASWLVVEPGWQVVAADGTEIGRVEEVVGDTGKDIFNGLVLSKGFLSKSRHVPSEEVTEIIDGCVRLGLSAAEAASLEPYNQPPPSQQIRPS